MNEAMEALRESIKRAEEVHGRAAEVAEVVSQLREAREVVVLPAA